MSAAWLLLGWLSAAHATTQEDVDELWRCLAAQDVACAEQVVQRERMDAASQGGLVAMAAHVAFYAADYPRAVDLMERAVSLGFQDDRDQLGLFRRTMHATAGWVEVERGRFRVRYRPGVDAILVDQAFQALEATHRHVTPLLGEPPPGSTVVELYPDGRSFIAASSLTKDDVEATGVVAISKWTRLLVSSPRALGRGYEWQSTLSHEYIHLVVAHATRDAAPVWLQEAIAKYLDGRWEHGRDAFQLDARAQGYLARALAENDLVTFDEMHPSFAKIKVLRDDGSIDQAASSRRASLAYAQVASLMEYCFERGGEQVLRKVLPLIRDGMDAREALARGAGAHAFSALVADWEVWIRQQPLLRTQLDALPTVLDGGTEAELDPVLSRRRDLANYLRLGELLAERGHHRAALLEYDKARDDDDPNSPLLANRVAASLVELGELDRAWRALEGVVTDYPGFPLTWRTMGGIARARGHRADALRYLEKSVALAPFHMETQLALLDLYREAGSPRLADQERLVRILRRGGEDEERPPVHERSGDYELPRDPEVAARLARPASGGPGSLQDQPAPSFRVQALDGARLELASLRGRVVVVDFWATWCGPCRAVMPALSRMQERWADAGLVVVGVSDEPENVVERWVAQEGRRGRAFQQTLALEDGSVRSAYGVRSIPTLVVIDQGGVVRLVHVGSGDMGAVEQLVGRLLGEPVDEVIP